MNDGGGRRLSRHPGWWFAFAAIAVASVWFAVRTFPVAFPIVTLDLAMDRPAALAAAARLAESNGWGPTGGWRQAASFGVDDTVRTFVELEGGGKDAFRAMLADGNYAAYTWQVRHFRQGDARETEVRFTPRGDPYGFHETLPESLAGASLDETAARAIAEAACPAWQVDLSRFVPVSAARETRPSGRTDHTFVYERPDVRAGEGRYRLRIVVSGDRVTELAHYLQVPEAFARRYESMRSANTGIAFGAQIALFVLYLIGGCGIGLFVLLRQRRVVGRPPLLWGAGIGLLSGIAQINTWPLAWMQYDTALPEQVFMVQMVGLALGLAVVNGAVLTVSFMAAESLTRKAFGHHPQLWRLWSRDVAGSTQVVGRTAGGYLLACLEFAFIVVLYLVTSRLFGWWVPSESLLQPDILATYLPWLAAVAPSMQAGFWEECLFRAVPLAGAALLGTRFGGRRAWIVGALLLQAMVFGGAHANYPSEPAYSRLVELTLPSIVWGLVYLAFGLLPVILTHYLFDLVLFALPLFTSHAPGVWVHQGMVALFGLAPLAIVAIARLRGARELPADAWNAAWQPAETTPAETPPEAATGAATASAFDAGRRRIVWGAGLVGLALWAASGPFHRDAPPLATARAGAVERAHEALRAEGFDPAPPWRTLPTTEGPESEAATFVWRESGPDGFRALLGGALRPPGWDVRVARFEGDVADRAEEWTVEVDGDGAVRRVRHQLPQGRPGDSLDVEVARGLAHRALHERLATEAQALREISAVQERQPQRRDWAFVFADSTLAGGGETRAEVDVSGAEVTDARWMVHVPEEWSRRFRSTESVLQMLRLTRLSVAVVASIAGAIVAIVWWSRRRVRAGVMAWPFLGALAVLLVVAFNQAPLIEARFSTAQPWGLQQTIVVVSLVVFQCLLAACGALLVGLAAAHRADAREVRAPVALGVGAGLAAAGIVALQRWLAGSAVPAWPSFAGAQTHLPLLAEALPPVWSVFVRSGLVLALLIGAQRATAGWTRRRAMFAPLLFLAGACLGQFGAAPGVGVWALHGLLAGGALVALHALVLRHDLTLVPAMMATLGVLGLARVAAANAYPGARAGAVVGVVLVVAVAAGLTRLLRGAREPGTAGISGGG